MALKAMKLMVLAAIGVVAVQGRTLWHQLDEYTFEQYVEEYDKDYAVGKEWTWREARFNDELARLREHNKDETKTWKEGINKFSASTEEEINTFKGYHSGMARDYRATSEIQTPPVHKGALPDSVDWRTKGVVTPVKDQEACGSCWAFASTETLESHWAIATGDLPVLAPQQLVDCTPNPNHCGGTGGCSGATAELAYDYIKGIGQTLESAYSYKGTTGKCKDAGIVAAANVTGHNDLPSNELDPLFTAVATVGPISVSMDASWGAYESGVYSGCSKAAVIDHAIQLVGYGGGKGEKKYWIVRNSWGSSWGEDGYIRIERFDSSDAYCGTDPDPADGSGCDGGPSEVKVCGMCGILFDTTYPTVDAN